MVKIPTTDEAVSPAFVDCRTQVMHDYGTLLAVWSQFELALEVKIARLAGLSPRDSSIILGGLSFGNKPAILYSLLNDRSLTDVAAKIRAVIDHTRRNALVHGVTGSDMIENRIVFYKREIGATYKVTHLTYSADEFNAHFERFRDLANEAMASLDLTLEDLEKYAGEAGLLEPTPPRSPVLPQDGETGSR